MGQDQQGEAKTDMAIQIGSRLTVLQGLIKMYIAEVLSKFPVVQHLRFGSLFKWEHDPQAAVPNISQHTKSQPTVTARPPRNMPPPATMASPKPRPKVFGGPFSTTTTAAPWVREPTSFPAGLSRHPAPGSPSSLRAGAGGPATGGRDQRLQ